MLAVEPEGTLGKFYGGLFAPLFPFDALRVFIHIEGRVGYCASCRNAIQAGSD